jgi:hypothetical protein
MPLRIKRIFPNEAPGKSRPTSKRPTWIFTTMNTTQTQPPTIDFDADSDERAVIDSFLTGKPLDPKTATRVHERAQKIRDRVFRENGLVDIGVPSIRELRGELP